MFNPAAYFVPTFLWSPWSLAAAATAAPLNAYNVDPSSVSVSGLSSGGFMAVQMGVAYSSLVKTGFAVLAGGPFDCARSQPYTSCVDDQVPSITQPLANMEAWNGAQIDPLSNLKSRKIFMEVGTADAVVGENPMLQLNSELSNFYTSSDVSYVTLDGVAHTFPTDFDSAGNSPCGESEYPFISNCGYDAAGQLLTWLYGTLEPRNNGTPTGATVPFSQTGSYGAQGMDTTGYLYVPRACAGASSAAVCKLHVALHGCDQSYSSLGFDFVDNTGYNKWADSNNIIILYPQAIPDDTVHVLMDGYESSNPLGCWDWVGWYGNTCDQKSGVQTSALAAQIDRIISGYTP